MGRTNPTLRDRLDGLEREWQPFRRSLRYRHQEGFDRLFERARGHADAAGQQNPPDVWQAFVVAVLLAQEREVQALEADVRTLAAEVEELATAVEELAAEGQALEGEGRTRTDAVRAPTDAAQVLPEDEQAPTDGG